MKSGITYKLNFYLIIGIFLSVIIPQKSHAQSDPLFTQYWAMPSLLNPAATGESDFLKIRGGARLQWIGIENAPKNFVATAESPFKLLNKRVGAGITINQETIGLFSNLLMEAQGSYKMKLGPGRLSIGLGIGYYNTRFKGSEAYIPNEDEYHQPNDPSIPDQDISGNAFDLSLALWYSHPKFYVGLSALHVTNPTIKLSKEGSVSTDTQQFETQFPRSIYFDVGSNIDLQNTLFTLQPSLLIGTDLSDFTAQITLRTTYNKFLSFGLAYRWNAAFCIMIGAEFKNFFLGYAYDLPTSGILKASTGSHEIVAGYQLKLDFSTKNTHSHKSIRIM